MQFKQDIGKVKSFSGGSINQTEFYSCTITKAYENQSASSLSQSIRFEVVTDSGQIGRFDLWVVGKDGTSNDKNGKELSAIVQVNDLMVILDINELKSKPGKVSIYDFDLKQDIEQRKMVFSYLIDQQIGIVFDMRPNTYTNKQGVEVTNQKLNFVRFYDAETRQSAAEKINGTDAKQWQNDINYYLQDKQTIKQAVSQPNSPQNSSPVDPINIDDDIPF